MIIGQYIAFDRSEDALCKGIVIAVAFGTHGLSELSIAPRFFVFGRRNIAAVRVEDRLFLNDPSGKRRAKCSCHDVGAKALRELPAEDGSGR